MSRQESEARQTQSGPQQGKIGIASDPHQLREGADRDSDELRGDLGVGGQRHPGDSSRDLAAQGRRIREEAEG